ncbi:MULTISPECIES: AI-2E family transporter [Paenibacillus]|uniref:Membrane protein n=2 Tax=Paenibacillus TaxID=44249 RepID=A0A0U2W6G9_9BACL|nr:MULTISPECIES: AI-2E family transporter [Paenibacillus]ALS23005.1 membrane protein [Paenibacillus naphthalenovorans]NTZ17399.1 AI-2E family transporter [Paenibacillus sp. JMULE4]GCL71934.1 AI-2E family transporter [Paenibacillus naphthalenovorans]SDI42962.1 Predicted PurR-regulated permease PerM [Paenibacillus naphthalenovorans]
MENIKRFFLNLTVRRFLIILVICLLLFSIRDMLNLILLTFLFIYIMNSLQHFLTKQINKYIPVNSKVIIILLYLILVTTIVIGIINYLPKLYVQIKQLKATLIGLSHLPVPQDELSQYVYKTIKDLDLQSYVRQGFEYILKISNWGTTFVLAIVLSFVFILEKNRIAAFTSRLKNSKISWLYEELEYFGKKFVLSFGKVLEAQLLIATCNTIFTVTGLWILGYPYLFALTIMIFLLSLVPVVGFLVSLIPLSIIGYAIGGYLMVIYVLSMIAVLHFLEGYFLNPKLMSSKVNLPMFYTFIILIFSEHYLGTWGLIVGIPIFIFLLDMLDVDTSA